MAAGVAYGTDELTDLCDFARPASGAARIKAISLALARRPRRVRTLLSLRELPVVELQLSSAEYDRWQHAQWPTGGEQLFGGHWAQAVIQTSSKEQEYLTGKHRQAVRTNISRARELGITATRLNDYDEFAAASGPVYDSRPGGEAVLDAMRNPSPADDFAWYAASTPAHEEPVIVAAVALFGDFGVLAVMVGNLGYSSVGYARYLLHTFILRDLAERGIRHLVVGSVLRESQGNLYFQKLLGYCVCNVRPVLSPSSGERKGDRAAAVRRLLMTGPAVKDAYQSPSGDSRRIVSPVSVRVGHEEWAATGCGDQTPSEPVVAIGPERRNPAL